MTSYCSAEANGHRKELLAAYKYPREIRIVSDLPKGATEKIVKQGLSA